MGAACRYYVPELMVKYGLLTVQKALVRGACNVGLLPNQGWKVCNMVADMVPNLVEVIGSHGPM